MKMQCFSSTFNIVGFFFHLVSQENMCCTAFKSHLFVLPPQWELQHIWLSSWFGSVSQTFCLHFVSVYRFFFLVFWRCCLLKWKRLYSSDWICERWCVNHQLILYFQVFKAIFKKKTSSLVQCVLLHSKQLMESLFKCVLIHGLSYWCCHLC